MYYLDPDSPYGNKSQGKVYQHHYVMCEHIGRPLEQDEVVHHIDRNRANNDLSNLQLMTRSEHVSLHLREDRGVKIEIRACAHCKKEFKVSAVETQKYCSQNCFQLFRRKFDPSPEELREMVWKMPTIYVAKHYGVSDAAINKRCKLYKIDKPPIGYWMKKFGGMSYEEYQRKMVEE